MRPRDMPFILLYHKRNRPFKQTFQKYAISVLGSSRSWPNRRPFECVDTDPGLVHSRCVIQCGHVPPNPLELAIWGTDPEERVGASQKKRRTQKWFSWTCRR
jgi:hypothetical protein